MSGGYLEGAQHLRSTCQEAYSLCQLTDVNNLNDVDNLCAWVLYLQQHLFHPPAGCCSCYSPHLTAAHLPGAVKEDNEHGELVESELYNAQVPPDQKSHVNTELELSPVAPPGLSTHLAWTPLHSEQQPHVAED